MFIRRLAVAACTALAIAGLALPAQAMSPANVPGHGARISKPASDFVSWRITPTGSTDQFRGLAAVSAEVAWVSGEHGTVLRTTDGGTHCTP